MIHHFSISASQPGIVAQALAKFWQTEILPFPMYPECYIVFAGDDQGTSIEIYPDGKILQPATPELPALVSTDRSPYSGFHAAISVPVDEQTVMRVCGELGWKCQKGVRGNFFHVMEVWVENHTLLELLTPSMSADYRAFASIENWKAIFGTAPQEHINSIAEQSESMHSSRGTEELP